MSEVQVELFTPSRLTDPAEGRALLRALEEHMPSWMPKRYGWSKPLRHTYSPDQAGHFWEQHAGGVMFTNVSRTLRGEVEVRTGPWDILSKIGLSGKAARAELEDGIGAFMAACGTSLDLAYAMAHIFTDKQADDYYTAWFEHPPPGDRVKTARQGTFPYFLRDLYWGNVFGPPYVELFGADRLRTAPAAVAAELRPGYFYLQVTDTILDLCDPETISRYQDARDAIKAHLGSDCFYEEGATSPRRAPAWRTAAEEGLWRPREGARITDEVRALLAKAPDR